MYVSLLLSVFFYLSTVRGTSDGLTDLVTWDPYSLIVNGERVFIYSGEFHSVRLPVPELWTEILQKYKANGLNAVSLYFFQSWHSPSRGVYDFETGAKNAQRLLDAAKNAGLYVLARPGPYVNGEANAGGYALWGSDGSAGSLRTSDETYHQFWLPYINGINAILQKNQITEGGPVIMEQMENELQETTHQAGNTLVTYMEQIENATRAAGIVVPFFSNEKGERSESWSTDYQNVGGAVNLYGLDSYPGGFSCTNPNTGWKILRNYYQWFQNYSSTQPGFFPEFEGGYFSGWGGIFYDECQSEHDSAFADLYYKNNIAQRATLQNIYMTYGGTNWGYNAAPVVYTSYDYSSPIRETRQILPKFSQAKLIGLFTRVSQDLLYTDMESNGTGNVVDTTAIFTWVLRNPNTTAGFYTVQHDNSTSRAVTNFEITLKTSIGSITVPSVQLDGHQSKIIVTDYRFGNQTLLYSSADVLTYGNFKTGSALTFYLEQGQVGEFAFAGTNITSQAWGATSVNSSTSTVGGKSYTKFVYTQQAGSTAVQLSNGAVVYLLERETAWTFWAPATTSDPNVSPSEHFFVVGPYLVREGSINGSTVAISGDNANTTTVEIFVGDSSVSHISWNGRALTTTKTAYGALTATIQGVSNTTISLPTLSDWKVASSFPEKNPSYDDSNWVVANHTTTLSPVKPLTLPVLYSSDYGYYTGNKIYRGYFGGTNATSVNITAQGGLAAGWAAYLNGAYLGGVFQPNLSVQSSSALLEFSQTKLQDTNVLTIMADYTGHDETSTKPDGDENPRGLLGVVLYAGSTSQSFTTWKIQGNAGGDFNLDPVRGPVNEGGIYGERLGWHLPGFNASFPTFTSGSPTTGLNQSDVAWYITDFDLNIPGNLDVPIGIEFDAPSGTQASVLLFVNGYQYGKYIPQIGPQTRFPVPPGILNQNGRNRLAMSLWAQTDAGARLSTVQLVQYGLYESSFNFDRDWSYLQPGWDSSRLQYA